MRTVEQKNRLLVGIVQPPSLEIYKTWPNKALSIHSGLSSGYPCFEPTLEISQNPLQPELSHDPEPGLCPWMLWFVRSLQL